MKQITNTLLFVTFLLLGIAQIGFSQAIEAVFYQIPKENQFFQREISTNLASLKLTGQLNQEVDSFRVSVFKNNQFFSQKTGASQTYQGQYYFDMTLDLAAELTTYRLETFAVHNGQSTFLEAVDGLLVGDAFLIMGQSNARAAYSILPDNMYMRSFGTDNIWRPADMSFGIWGNVIADSLVRNQKVPVAIINTAVSGSALAENMPETPIFEETIARLEAANLLGHIRAFYWFQGENDAGSGKTAAYYKSNYIQFDAALEQHITTIDKKYLIQIRNSCFANEANAVYIQEAQRQLADEIPNYSYMSTQGLEHDGCHFSGLAYLNLGKHLYHLLARDLYDAPNSANIEAPNINRVFQSAPTELTLETRHVNDVLQWLGQVETEFSLNNAPNVVINGGFAFQHKIILSLSDSLPQGASLSYRGHGGGLDTLPVVRNAKGVGIMAFHDFPIEQTINIAEICENGLDDDGNGLTDADDPACDCTQNPAIPCPGFDCAHISAEDDNGQIRLLNTSIPIFMAQVYDENWAILHNELYYDRAEQQLMPDFGTGTFNIIVKAFDENWNFLCEKLLSTKVNEAITPPPTGTCDAIKVEVSGDEIIVQGLLSPIVTVAVYDANWNTIHSFYAPPLQDTMHISNLLLGSYFVKVGLDSSDWSELCKKEIYVDIQSVLVDTALRCEDLILEQKNQTLSIQNIADMRRSIQVWDVAWMDLYTCFSPVCDASELNFTLPSSDPVYVKITYFDAQWNVDCTKETFVYETAISKQKIEGGVLETKEPLAKFTLYPNPNSGRFALFLPEQVHIDFTINIYNSIGIKVQTIEAKAPSTQEIDLTALKKGLYWVVLEANGWRTTRSILTQE